MHAGHMPLPGVSERAEEGRLQPCQPWGGRHICFQAVCAAGTLVSGLGLACVGNAYFTNMCRRGVDVFRPIRT